MDSSELSSFLELLQRVLWKGRLIISYVLTLSCYFLYFDALTSGALALPVLASGATFKMQTTQSRAHTSNSGLIFPCPIHPWTKYQTTRASPHAPEPAESIQTSKTCLLLPMEIKRGSCPRFLCSLCLLTHLGASPCGPATELANLLLLGSVGIIIFSMATVSCYGGLAVYL